MGNPQKDTLGIALLAAGVLLLQAGSLRSDEVALTGIIGVLNPPRAFLEIETPGAPVQRINLREGERAGNIELLAVDVARNRVRIRNAGIEQEIGFGGARSAPGANRPAAPVAVQPIVVPSGSASSERSFSSSVLVVGRRDRNPTNDPDQNAGVRSEFPAAFASPPPYQDAQETPQTFSELSPGLAVPEFVSPQFTDASPEISARPKDRINSFDRRLQELLSRRGPTERASPNLPVPAPPQEFPGPLGGTDNRGYNAKAAVSDALVAWPSDPRTMEWLNAIAEQERRTQRHPRR